MLLDLPMSSGLCLHSQNVELGAARAARSHHKQPKGRSQAPTGSGVACPPRERGIDARCSSQSATLSVGSPSVCAFLIRCPGDWTNVFLFTHTPRESRGSRNRTSRVERLAGLSRPVLTRSRRAIGCPRAGAPRASTSRQGSTAASWMTGSPWPGSTRRAMTRIACAGPRSLSSSRLQANRQSASVPAAARPHQAGKHRALPRH